MNKAIFGGLIAFILLGLYVFAIFHAIQLALGYQQNQEFSEGLITVLNLVGGLVSAIVVIELAIKQPGKPLGAHWLEDPDLYKKLLIFLTTTYVVAWVVCGLASFVVGNIMSPNKVPALTEYGKIWLGLAVAAAYSFFGIKQGE